MAKGGIELGAWDIVYKGRDSLKSQIVADFVAEWIELQTPGPPDKSSSWTMYFDGSKRNEGAGAGVVLISPQGDKLRYVLQIKFPEGDKEGVVGMDVAEPVVGEERALHWLGW